MAKQIFEEANKIWDQFTRKAKEKEFNFSLPVYKSLLSIFHVGKYYYYVFNVKEISFEVMSEEMPDLLGYEVAEVDVPFFLARIHPDDQPYFLNFEYKVTDFFTALQPEERLNYKVSYDYRIQKKDGSYIRILQQVVTIQLDEDKRVLRTLGIHTDITHLKTQGIPSLSLIGLNGAPSYMNVDVKKVFAVSNVVLSNREREILALLIQGKNTQQISQELFLSPFTVNTHRRNLRKKTGCRNTATLIRQTIANGWL